MTYALDTNIIVHYLRKEAGVIRNFRDAVVRGDDILVPKVVNYELCRGFRFRPAPGKESSYKILIEQCGIIPMDDASWIRAEHICVELYRKRFTVGEMDILIAAQCAAHSYTLVTNNTKDFEKIDGLRLEDWTTHG